MIKEIANLTGGRVLDRIFVCVVKHSFDMINAICKGVPKHNE